MSGQLLSIILIIITVLFSLGLISGLIGIYVYKRKHHLPTGECQYCHINKKKLVKQYRSFSNSSSK